MALAKQEVSIDFAGGLERKVDGRTVLPGKLVTADDCEFSDNGTLKKRAGYDTITVATLGSGGAVSGATKFATRGDELLVESSTGLHAVQETPAGAVQRSANFVRTSVGLRTLSAQADNVHSVDCALANNLSVWVWSVTTVAVPNAVYAAVYDEQTGAAMVVDTQIHAAAGQPRVVWDAANSRFRIYYITNAGTLDQVSINPIDPTAVSAATTVVSDPFPEGGAGGARMDAIYDSLTTNIFIAYRRSTGAGGGTNVIRVSSGTSVSHTYSDATRFPDQGLGIAVFSSGRVGIAIADSVGGTPGVMITTLSATLGGAASANFATDANPRRIGIVASGSGARVVWEDGASLVANTLRLIRAGTVTDAPVVSSETVVMRGVGIASKPFVVNGTPYVTAAFISNIQPTVYVVALDRALGVVAKAMQSTAGLYASALTYSWNLPSIVTDPGSTTGVVIPVYQQGPLRLVGGVNVTYPAVARLTVRFEHTAYPLQELEFAGLTLFAGGNPMVYDGQALFEAGFHQYPDPDGVAVTMTGAGGSLSAGVYGVALVWEAVDAAGRRWQSAPSIAESATAVANDTASVVCPMDRLTRRSNVRLVVYRTIANGTIYYRDTAATGSIVNDPTADSVTLTFTTSDASLQRNEVLYTTGGALENDAWPACRVMTVHANRLFLGGLEDENQVRFTEELISGIAPNTSETYVVNARPAAGVVTALASMDDKLVMLAERAAMFTYGEGPDRLGNGAFAEPMLALADHGALRASPSTALTPEGLWFHSKQGLRLLTRGLSLGMNPEGRPLGSEVDVYVTGSAAAATTGIAAIIPVPAKQQIRFFDRTIVLVWDYLRRQWSRWTNHAFRAAVTWQGEVVMLGASSTVRVTSSGATTDAGSTITPVAKTAPIRVSALQGFQRLWHAHLLGSFTSSTTLKVYRDHSASADPTATAPGTVTQFRHHLKTQKCQVAAFEISGFSELANMTLEVGVMRGAARLPSGQSV